MRAGARVKCVNEHYCKIEVLCAAIGRRCHPRVVLRQHRIRRRSRPLHVAQPDTVSLPVPTHWGLDSNPNSWSSCPAALGMDVGLVALTSALFLGIGYATRMFEVFAPLARHLPTDGCLCGGCANRV